MVLLRSRQLDKIMYQIFSLGEDFNPKNVDGELIQTKAHESVYGAYSYEFDTNRGKLFFSVMNGKLHEITYNYRSIFPWANRRKIKFLFNSYRPGGNWIETVKNHLGKMFKSENEEYFAASCKRTRTTSFGTMFFHDEKYRINC